MMLRKTDYETLQRKIDHESKPEIKNPDITAISEFLCIQSCDNHC